MRDLSIGSINALGKQMIRPRCSVHALEPAAISCARIDEKEKSLRANGRPSALFPLNLGAYRALVYRGMFVSRPGSYA